MPKNQAPRPVGRDRCLDRLTSVLRSDEREAIAFRGGAIFYAAYGSNQDLLKNLRIHTSRSY